jgi:hypothetical protein
MTQGGGRGTRVIAELFLKGCHRSWWESGFFSEAWGIFLAADVMSPPHSGRMRGNL